MSDYIFIRIAMNYLSPILPYSYQDDQLYLLFNVKDVFILLHHITFSVILIILPVICVFINCVSRKTANKNVRFSSDDYCIFKLTFRVIIMSVILVVIFSKIKKSSKHRLHQPINSNSRVKDKVVVLYKPVNNHQQ